MKKCKIYFKDNEEGFEAAVIDGLILLSAPQRDNIEPNHIVNGQFYYPPAYVAKKHLRCFFLGAGMGYSRIPFSVNCNWNEYIEICGRINMICSLRHDFYVHWRDDEIEKFNSSGEKWGYFNGCTGEIEIPPQWDWCGNFEREWEFAVVKGKGVCGLINTDGSYCILPDYNYARSVNLRFIDIKMSVACHIYFVKAEAHGKWGAFDLTDTIDYHKAVNPEKPEVYYEWDDIWLYEYVNGDIWGGYTVMEKTDDGRELYGIVNPRDKDKNEIVARNLTEKPFLYELPESTRQNTYRDGGGSPPGRYRIIIKDDKYGLVEDYPYGYSKLLHEPKHTYEQIIKAAGKNDMKYEIEYYAKLMAGTPRRVQGREGDGWDTVPEDIRDKVRAHMIEKGWEQ